MRKKKAAVEGARTTSWCTVPLAVVIARRITPSASPSSRRKMKSTQKCE